MLNLRPDQLMNGDETGLNWGIGPMYLYPPRWQHRAQSKLNADNKARITALPAVDAADDFIPMFFIIKHSVSKDATDLTSVQVIRKLHKKPGFTPEDGWSHCMWRNKICGKRYKMQYPIHTNGDVTTSQHRAWNDTQASSIY